MMFIDASFFPSSSACAPSPISIKASSPMSITATPFSAIPIKHDRLANGILNNTVSANADSQVSTHAYFWASTEQKIQTQVH